MAYQGEERCDQTVLVVDDVFINRELLAGMLTVMGYKVLRASDGAEAVQLFLDKRPWLVVMDVYMPVMDGIEATRQIKELAGNNFVPVLFVTGSQDETLVERCIDIGGDDFLYRPYNSAVLKGKLKSMRRFSRLYHQLQTYHAGVQREKEVADKLLSGAIEGRNIALSQVNIHKQPASIFCGDIHLTAFRPNGDINILLGDFTGHGITSIVGSLPVAETFRAMTRKGFNGSEILYELNRKLCEILPIEMFLAAVLVTISKEEGVAYIWNCGMPDVYVIPPSSESIKYRVSSVEPPLGIVELLESMDGDVLQIEPNDRIILVSDGVEEARNDDGSMFGRERLEQALLDGSMSGSLTQSVMTALKNFVGGCDQDDDLSLIEVPCNIDLPEALIVNPKPLNRSDNKSVEGGEWRWSLELTGGSLAKINPVPMLLNQLQEIQGVNDGLQPVYTIITELYLNALDHGVLEMDSSLKDSPHGFARYFSDRELKLMALTEGFVKIAVVYQPLTTKSGLLRIDMHDSGPGFDYEYWLQRREPDDSGGQPLFSGRGVKLIAGLSEVLEYSNNGSSVAVVYHWSHSD